MSTANLDSANLKSLPYGGLINEDVMQKIWDISKIPLPLTDMIGSDDCGNSYKEWTTDRLRDPDITNANVDGSDQDTNTTNPTEAGAADSDGEPLRQGNHCQISTKVVKVSTRSRNSNTIGRSDELGYQVMKRQRELRRDVEAIMLTHQASLPDDGDSQAGKAGGLGSWIGKNGKFADDTGASLGGYNSTTGLTVAPTVTAVAALTETLVRDVCEMVYAEGGDPSVFMSIPAVVRRFSSYLFTSSARIATLTSQTGQGQSGLTAQGSVNVFVTDFGVVLDLVANRLQQGDASVANEATAYILDPAYLSIGYLHGYRAEPLAKTGLSDKRQMAVDWTLICRSSRAQGAIFAIDSTAAVTA